MLEKFRDPTDVSSAMNEPPSAASFLSVLLGGRIAEPIDQHETGRDDRRLAAAMLKYDREQPEVQGSTMTRFIAVLLPMLLMAPSVAHAQWKSLTKKDEMTDEKLGIAAVVAKGKEPRTSAGLTVHCSRG